MHRALIRKLVCGGLLACQVACIEAALLGENPSDAGTMATAAPTIQGPSTLPAPNAQQFPVEATSTIAPTWIYDFPCGDSCAAQPHIERAPDGGVWAALVTSAEPVGFGELVFVNLNALGQTLGYYTSSLAQLDFSSPLLVDSELRPYMLRWPAILNSNAEIAQIYRVDEGELRATRLPAGLLQSDTKFLSALADGSYLEMSDEGDTHVTHYAPGGQQLWRQHDLRAVPRQGGHRYVVDGPLYLHDGSLAIVDLDKTNGGPVVEPTHPGLTVLNADGSLRWDMILFPPYQVTGASHLVVPNHGAGLVLASNLTVDSDVQIVSYDGDGMVLGHWVGNRVGYHTVGPRALGVDERGDLYPVLLSGERDKPRLTVCKLHAANPSTPTSCVALEISPPEGYSSASWPDMGIDITLTEPNVAVLGLHRGDGDALLTSVVRFDLPL